MMNSVLELRNVSKKYGNLIALQRISLSFSPGIYGLLGPNGSGKSTMIHLLTDCIRRDEGDVLYKGREIRSLGSAYRSNVGYMPQMGGYYKEFTVRQFLLYMSNLKGMRRKEARVRIDALLEEMHLTEKKNTKIAGLSGGMRQRMMLAEALLSGPEILILDEPTAGVDPQERVSIRNYISRIAEGKVVIIATHIVSDIESIAKRIVLLKEGSIIAYGTPAELVADVAGYTYETWVASEQIHALQERYVIGSISAEERGLRVKIITDQIPDMTTFHSCSANLEDVYLWEYRPVFKKGSC